MKKRISSASNALIVLGFIILFHITQMLAFLGRKREGEEEEERERGRERTIK